VSIRQSAEVIPMSAVVARRLWKRPEEDSVEVYDWEGYAGERLCRMFIAQVIGSVDFCEYP